MNEKNVRENGKAQRLLSLGAGAREDEKTQRLESLGVWVGMMS